MAHLLSVLTLFVLTLAVFPGSSADFALKASLLHVISPAGLFLSAPFAESSCALLSFLGMLAFARSRAGPASTTTWAQDQLVLLAGLVFGIAATFRSNAILNGLLLLAEAFRTLYSLIYDFHLTKVRRLLVTGLAGLFVAAGFLLPQYLAYREYCTPSNLQPREWCERTLPSIYTFVQAHYWYGLQTPSVFSS